MTHTIKTLVDVFSVLEEKIKQPEAFGLKPVHLTKIAAIDERIYQATLETERGIVPFFLDERGRQHEELHQASILGQVGDETHAEPLRLINHPVHQKAAENYLDAAYKGSSDNVKI